MQPLIRLEKVLLLREPININDRSTERKTRNSHHDDVHENVTEKETSHPFSFFRDSVPSRPVQEKGN